MDNQNKLNELAVLSACIDSLHRAGKTDEVSAVAAKIVELVGKLM